MIGLAPYDAPPAAGLLVLSATETAIGAAASLRHRIERRRRGKRFP